MRFKFDGTNLPRGLFFSIQADNFVKTSKGNGNSGGISDTFI